MLPSDAWAVRESGWAAGAFGISVAWLKRCHGIDLDNSYDYCKPYTQLPLNQTWCDCTGKVPPEGLKYQRQHCQGFLRTSKIKYGPRH